MELALTVEELSFRYPKAREAALTHVSFQIEAGSFVGLVGPNGAGKTTLMSILSSLITPDSGKIRYFDGVLKEPRGFVAIAPQEIALYPTLTAQENLRFFARLGQVGKSEMEERVNWCLEFVGLTNQRHHQVKNYSGGMKRRLNIAAALVTKPRILQLDEPTVGVDPQSRHLILNALNHLNREGTTILYSSHYLEEVEKLCRQLILIDHGTKIFDGIISDFKTANKESTLESRFMELTGSKNRDSVH